MQPNADLAAINLINLEVNLPYLSETDLYQRLSKILIK